MSAVEPVTAAAFDAAAPQVLRPRLMACARVPRWCTELLDGRPFGTREAILEFADACARSWSDDEVEAALAGHPRIGERAVGADAEAEASRREQGGLAGDVRSEREWVAANRAYEGRFGRIFLIRAAGRSSTEMLEELRRRMALDPAEEAVERSRQLREIAVLRLGELVVPALGQE